MTDSSLIDRIVNGVLDQLGRGGTAPGTPAAPGKSAPKPVVAIPAKVVASLSISEKVITADLLADRLNGERSITVPAKAIVTPAAKDFLKEQGIDLQRCDAAKAKPAAPTPGNAVPSKGNTPAKTELAPLLIIVKHTDAVANLWEHLQPAWKRELVGCPDDAAKLAIGELSRGGASQVVILAEQTFRAACLANRSDRVKAVPITSLLDIKSARTQIRVNTWCVDPTDRSWFELRNLFKSLTSNS